MKLALAGVLVALLGADARAETPRTVRGETIHVEGKAPPGTPPKPAKRYHAIAPRYSDYAVEHDVWARAWLLLDIDARGAVTRVKLVRKPGADLDQIAIDTAMKMKFEPARDALGAPKASQLLWSIEWPSWGWLIAHEGLATKIPASVNGVPCAGSGQPLNLDAVHPVYRDCTLPDVSKIEALPWQTK
ncbi:MAG TPA: energy transducer TonB [Kofleriaceae bacterium]|jgi:hypothetical protein|nr:energy transducer TonB [Kofleriaceae bacterium]